MRGKEMLEAVGYVEPTLIEKGEKKKRIDWKRWTAIAACACLVLGGALIYRHSLPKYATEILSISDMQIGMGYEGYQVYDVNEIRRDNPTDGAKIKALNAYRNTISYDERLYPSGQDLDAMKEYLLTLAEKFGLEFVPLQKMFDEANADAPQSGYWLADGVHPSAAGHELIKRQWLKAFQELK